MSHTGKKTDQAGSLKDNDRSLEKKMWFRDFIAELKSDTSNYKSYCCRVHVPNLRINDHARNIKRFQAFVIHFKHTVFASE